MILIKVAAVLTVDNGTALAGWQKRPSLIGECSHQKKYIITHGYICISYAHSMSTGISRITVNKKSTLATYT